MHQEENSFLKHNVPDEILEKIISFVPSKKNCFLVSKAFHRESINATRKKCFLNVNEYNIGSEDFMNIQWAFNAVIWLGHPDKPYIDVFVTRGRNFFEKFGSQIEHLLISGINVKKSFFLEVLSQMPNLVELHMMRCNITDDGKPLPVYAAPELSKLKNLTFFECRPPSEIFGNIMSVQCFDFYAADKKRLNLKFIHQWKHLEDVSISCKSIDNQSLEHLCRVDLKSLSVWTDNARTSRQVAALIEAQPRLTYLHVGVNHSEELGVLQHIVKLQHLEDLSMSIPIPEQLIRDIIRMPKLKKLKLLLFDKDVLNAFCATKNLQLETLRIDILTMRHFPNELQPLAISNAFPNLKYLEVYGFDGSLDCFNRLRNLKTFCITVGNINDDGCAVLEVNKSVRQLEANFFNFSPSVLGRLIRIMPNIERLRIHIYNNEYPLDNEAAKTLFNEVFNLKNLVEIECQPKLLLNEGIADCINNGSGSSKIQRIKFAQREWQSVASAYEKQFPFKRGDFGTSMVTLSRF